MSKTKKRNPADGIDKVTAIAEYFTMEGQWKRFRSIALSEASVPTGSLQENEMKKAFKSGMAAAAFTIIEGAHQLPEGIAASLCDRWILEYKPFMTGQLERQKMSNQKENLN